MEVNQEQTVLLIEFIVKIQYHKHIISKAQ